jgi:hypothetical protein
MLGAEFLRGWIMALTLSLGSDVLDFSLPATDCNVYSLKILEM